MTTTEKQMQAVISEEMIAERYSVLASTSATIPITTQEPAVSPAAAAGRPPGCGRR